MKVPMSIEESDRVACFCILVGTKCPLTRVLSVVLINAFLLFFNRTEKGLIMTTEMQEIAIMEDKPLLTGQTDSVKVIDIKTHTKIMIMLTFIH